MQQDKTKKHSADNEITELSSRRYAFVMTLKILHATRQTIPFVDNEINY